MWYSQALRLRRICSSVDDSESQLKNLDEQFVKRHYNKEMITTQIEKAKGVPRSDLLQYRPRKSTNRVSFVTTYCPLLKSVNATFCKHLRTLHQYPELKQIFKEPPLLAFRRPPNIRDLLVRVKVTSDCEEHSYIRLLQNIFFLI